MKAPTPRRFVCDQLGYPLEQHFYTTEDGHINCVYRIPGKKGTKEGTIPKDASRPVVIYQHGLCDCFMGIIADEEDSLGI